MHIAFFTDTYKPTVNGVVTSVALFAQQLRSQGHTVWIFGPATKKFTEPFFYSFTSFSLPIYPDFRVGMPFSTKLFKQFHNVPFDVVHCHTPGPVGLLGLVFSQRRKIPRVLTYHTLISAYGKYYLPRYVPGLQSLVTGIDKLFSNHFQAVVAPTTTIKKYLVASGVKPRIAVIPTGIDLERFVPSTDSPTAYQKFFPTNKKIIGCVTRIAKEKNLAFLLEVFKILHCTNQQTHLCFIGGGPYLPQLKKLVHKLELSPWVSFTGAVPNEQVPMLLRFLDVFTYPCTTDTQGMVVMEALAAAKPVVLLDEPVFKVFVKQGKNGYHVSSNANLFAQKINHILTHPRLQQSMAKVSQQLAQNYSIVQQAKKLIGLYQSLV